MPYPHVPSHGGEMIGAEENLKLATKRPWLSSMRMECPANLLFYSPTRGIRLESFELQIMKGMAHHRCYVVARGLDLAWTDQDMTRTQLCGDMAVRAVAETRRLMRG